MNNKKFRLLAGITLVVVMFVLYLVLVNNDGSSRPTQQNSDGVVLK
jgi:hypothetical protein